VLFAALALSLALEGSAAAQAMFTASLGNVFGGDAASKKTVWAVAIGGGGAHSIGSELEYAEARNFFETPNGVGEGKVTTVMPSIYVAIPISRVRPYGIFGFGLIRARREANSGAAFTNVTDNDFGYNIGGGVTLMFAEHAGVRADLRRFKVRASDGISFHRFTVGLVLGG
jgi:hypothetical protein